MAAALALSERGRGLTAPNPNVGCVIVRDGRVVGRGWTQPGGRPHAEAMALGEAGALAEGATVYATLEPCAHRSPRGPACADSLAAARPARVVAAIGDPDPRTAGEGFARLRAAGIVVESGLLAAEARRAMAGFLMRQAQGRPLVTLKLATSLDGRIALADGSSRWITGDAARAHVHLERARHEAILVGRGTWEADAPRLDVRLPGLEGRGPRRILLSARQSRGGGNSDETGGLGSRVRGNDEEVLGGVQEIAALSGVDHLFVEGGAVTAASFLRADLVDRLLLYRAPILIGDGKPALGDIGLTDLAAAHGRWRLDDARMLGSDRFEAYLRQRN
ncbi:bifunctional diaminohydroxyphosphoribosylaminopyrimidine deaminase/5-amino-6-(5-phosphoribosylamino)uracil reductase RibD [Sphingomonas sp. AP4-R1]|uniref:bifunctional diaminohydroxyphosphoribosylaminopyrimidine deaminase/5-amino-6-(5-phosphoribosylamino)uracil reductase RibD n=1 Tax=Sphingomonas sp. AP4-R1 TaxID=2735134 RepID=UPI001493513A|nr:bifunctional diaminohydroxyphosphoribosylaminopyrimidine deaminase/5-amino-6-(5-phosphoribosylamino)uracil reductase RibD [Sphingomonas sp. AP4-R1]QJU56730.1 bifunctional diaminohydroxyphosphoribosylaminopyrimidine deaminase/5-amino-6-(5-phosphoribosylamino)uracil reductase RibD [Sphingomonas sp. AP4-R1]